MIKFLQIIIDGGLVGLVYGLVAVSFVVIYRASKIVNLAQGEVLVIGALLLWTFTLGAPKLGLQIPLLAGIALTLLGCVAFRTHSRATGVSPADRAVAVCDLHGQHRAAGDAARSCATDLDRGDAAVPPGSAVRRVRYRTVPG